jgi:energy-coupling factor transport system permease protein
MIITWNYKPRDTIVQRFDPRARLLFFLCAIFAIILVWDVRVMVGWLVFALAVLRLAGLTWGETRRFWLIVIPLLLGFALVTALTGRDLGPATKLQGEHFIATWPLRFGGLGTLTLGLSVERLVFALAQFARMFALATLGLVLTFTINPNHYGVVFRRLGLSDKFAYAADLAFRLVPTVAADFQTTLDAQKARGYELDRAGNLFQQVRNLAPLVVPVTIGTILSGEEIIDAMDLRAFGTTPKRSWVVELQYQRRDYVLIAAGVLVLTLTLVLRSLGYSQFWMPGWLLAVFGY